MSELWIKSIPDSKQFGQNMPMRMSRKSSQLAPAALTIPYFRFLAGLLLRQPTPTTADTYPVPNASLTVDPHVRTPAAVCNIV